MPSNAYQLFENKLIIDVDRLIHTHTTLNHDGRGRRGFGHITRSGIFMLCAAWEVYHEELVKESARCILRNSENPTDLPNKAQNAIINYYDNLKDRSKMLDLASGSWKSIYLNQCDESVADLNTPNVHNLNELYKKFIGVPKILDFWSVEASDINELVSVRGDIAHNGSGASYVNINYLRSSITLIKKTIIENDNAMLDYIKDNYNKGISPWYRKNT